MPCAMPNDKTVDLHISMTRIGAVVVGVVGVVLATFDVLHPEWPPLSAPAAVFINISCVMWIRSYFAALHQRERVAFDMGRDTERRLSLVATPHDRTY